MKIPIKTLVAALIILTGFNSAFLGDLCYAQNEDLRKNVPFFKQQVVIYKDWLKHSGLAQVLVVDQIEVDSGNISLLMTFNDQKVEVPVAAWTQLKKDYENDNPLKLEEFLFFRMVHLMEVRDDQAILEIFDKVTNSTFFSEIYMDNDELIIESSILKSVKKDIVIEKVDLTRIKSYSKVRLDSLLPKDKVFENIINYSTKKFGVKKCGDRVAEVTVRERKRLLRFEVKNLCREVLKDEANPLLAQILGKIGYDAQWVKREMLNIIIIYSGSESAVNLFCEIQGKYGSGFYKPRLSGYIDMEPEFSEYMNRFADVFAEEIRLELIR